MRLAAALGLPSAAGAQGSAEPDAVSVWARVLFGPDGKPIEGEYRLTLDFTTLDSSPENFREDEFLRLLRGR